MAKPWDITGDDINIWSHRVEASAVLPDLVRRLLLATSTIGTLDMRADGGVYVGGWDGIVQAFRSSAFCPRGQSVWELSVQGASRKFNEDFSKRTEDPPSPIQPAATTYVAVTARRFRDKVQWATDRRVLGKWIDVRLLDADDLAMWVTQAPAVARWFAAQLDKPSYDVLDLDAFLARWKSRTTPPLPVELALAGRDRGRAAEYVRDWARAARTQPLVVQGDTQEEALLFTAAALVLAPEADFWRARTLVVESPEALRWASRIVAAESLILLPSFEGPVAALAESTAHIVIPLDRSTSGAVRPLLLEPAPHRRFAEILADAGFSRDEAERRSAESGGKLSSLARLYGYVALPGWATSLAPIPLASMLLIGAFQPENEADREVVRALGAEPREVEGLCERLRIIPDAATVRDQEHWGRAVWTWRAPGDAWKQLVGSIPAETLRRFQATIATVLGARDPRLDLHPDERFAASVHGKVLLESPPLREGMVRSLVRLALSDTELAALHGTRRGSGLADTVVRGLLQPDWQCWASVADLLPLLAEAAPEVFLDCLEVSLRNGDKGAAHLLAEEGQFGSPHTGLLWSLETLGWSEQYMARVASALVDLSEYDMERPEKRGRIANRPVACVHNLLHLSFAQTRASADARRATWRRLVSREIGYGFVIGQIGSVGSPGFMMPARSPEFRPWTPPSEEEFQRRANQETANNLNFLVDLALEYAAKDATSWSQLFDASSRLPERLSRKLLDTLDARRAEIRDTAGLLWKSLRHSLFLDSGGAVPFETGEERGQVERLYEAFTPEDPILRCAWLFDPRPELPERVEGGWREKEKIIQERRALVVAELWARQDKWEQLALLTAAVRKKDILGTLGKTLGAARFAQELETTLLRGSHDEAYDSLLVPYAVKRFYALEANGPVWIESVLRELLNNARFDDAVVIASTVREGDMLGQFWDRLDALGEPLRSAYWQRLTMPPSAEKPADWDRVVERLLEAGNLLVAAEAIEWAKEKVAAPIVVRALKALRDDSNKLIPFVENPHGAYSLEQMIVRAESEPSVDLALLVAVEERYLRLTQGHWEGARHYFAAMGEAPSMFTSLIFAMYRREGQLQPAAGDELNAGLTAATMAFFVLAAWQGYPGQGLSPTEREHRLHAWANEALQLCLAEERGAVGAIEVAKVLARAPAGEDGHWPCVAARRIVESGKWPAFVDGLSAAKRNSRGVVSRTIGEDGTQERDIVDAFQASANALRAEAPHTAALLDHLARFYGDEAQDADISAQTNLRRLGAEPEDFAIPANETSPPQPPLPTPPVLPGIIKLDSLHLKDLCTIEDLTLDFSAPEAERGQWIVLLGENGTGKTTFLRALALALTTFNTAVHAYGNLPPDANMVRKDALMANCTVKSGGQSYQLILTKGGRETQLAQQPNGTTLRPLVFGYGCRRGSAFGGARVAEIEVASRDIATLFDPSASIYPAFDWLKKQKLLARENPENRGLIFDALTSGLCGLLPEVTKIDVHHDNVWVTAPALGGEVPMAALSDGYLTTIGWVIDLLASWFERSEQLNLPVTSKFYEEMTGVVLLDEIDLHLHPRWQLRVIADVRRLFRRMTFVVTTHNPAAVVGAKPGEIWILKNEDGRIHAEQRSEPPKLMTGSEIYTSYFGIPYMYPDLAEKMQRYGFLAGKAARTNEEESEVQQILIELRAEGVDPGWEPVPREEPRPRRTGKKATQV